MKTIASILQLIGAAQGVFFSLVLLNLPRGNRRANPWLAVFIICFSLNMVGSVLYDERLVLTYPHLGLLTQPLGTVLGISLFLYVKALTEKEYQFRSWQWLHLLPILLHVLWLMPFYFLPAEEKRVLLESSYTAFPANWKISFYFSNLVNSIYIPLTMVTTLRHERHIRQLYSNIRDKTLDWVRTFMYIGTVIFLTCVVMSLFDIALADTISNLLFALTIYIMGYRAMRQPEIFTDLSAQTVAETDEPALVKIPVKYEKSGLSEEKAQALMVKLDVLFFEEKIYLDPELTLQQLAERLGVKPHQVSQLLNQYKQQSFFDFVNGQRVEHFKATVNDPTNAHLSLLAIAFDSGFNSKATFNAVFKKITGRTPSSFRNEFSQ